VCLVEKRLQEWRTLRNLEGKKTKLACSLAAKERKQKQNNQQENKKKQETF
jgi:hypothetical protein